jgi:beta-N-acetylhexosaminidase
MTLEQKVGQLFLMGFDGTSLTPENGALVRDLHLGGVVLFARNVENPAQVRQFSADLQAIADPLPLFIAADQEGGLVVRIESGATVFPGNMALGATRDPNLAQQAAQVGAEELLAMGINMNLAPVLDANTNPLNPVIGVRSFGSDVERVGSFGAAAIMGLQGSGVSAVAKHFPGHGDTDLDPHLELPTVRRSLEELDAQELEPFRMAIDDGVDGIMTAHIVLPALEPVPELPATLSHTVLTGLLRERLGYQGLIITDALDMGAIRNQRSAATAAVLAFEAGADMLLLAGISSDDREHLREGPQALIDAVRSGRISEQRIDESVRRILGTKLRRGIIAGLVEPPPQPDLEIVGSPDHRALALEIARRAITLVRDDAGLLPLDPGRRILVVQQDHPTRSLVVEEGAAGDLAAAVGQYAAQVDQVTLSPIPLPEELDLVRQKAAEAEIVIFASYDLIQQPEHQALAAELAAAGHTMVLVMLRGPYDASALPEIPTVLAAYGDRPVALQAAAEALFGQLEPQGTLPVELP